MPKEMVVLGPPGTGKTTSMVTTTKGWFDAGIGPNEIAYLAFTKAAAKEAAGRVLDEEFKKDYGERLPYFRTLHSLAFMGLKKAKPDIRLVTPADMKGFSKWSSLEGSFSIMEWEDIAEAYRKLLERRGQDSKTEWDDCLQAYTLSRISAKTPADLHVAKTRYSSIAYAVLGRIEPDDYKVFVEKYETYKQVNGLIDFTDMLVYAFMEMEPLDGVRKVVVDECFPKGTRILMHDGHTKPIEQINLGDEVLGVDHGCGQLKKAKVLEKRRRTSGDLVILNGDLTLTSNHPIFVLGKGYVPARDIKQGDKIFRCAHNRNRLRDLWRQKGSRQICGAEGADDLFQEMWWCQKISKNSGPSEMQFLRDHVYENKKSEQEVLLRIVRQGGKKGKREVETSENKVPYMWSRSNKEAFSGEAESKNVRPEMCGCLYEAANYRRIMEKNWRQEQEIIQSHLRGLREGDDKNRQAKREKVEILQPEMWGKNKVYKRRSGEAFEVYESKQSNEVKSMQREDEGFTGGAQAADSRGKWKRSYKTTGIASRETGGRMASRTSDFDRNQELESGGARYCACWLKDCRGMRRSFTWDQKTEEYRQEERKNSNRSWMDDPQIHKQDNFRTNRFHCWVDHVRSVEKRKGCKTVYNIGTETENYFAESILVHNCQDMSPILYSVADRLFSNAEEIWWAGDDDQSIYKFSAADAGMFIERARRSTRIFLRQTHRFGDEIVDFSKQIISHVSDRVKKEVLGAKGKSHDIRMVGDFRPITVGNTLLLHRHVAGCQALAQMYIEGGLPFRNERGRDPLGASARVTAYKALRDLADGKTVLAGSALRLIDDLMPSRVIDETKNNAVIRLIVHGAKKRMQNMNPSGEMNIMDLIRAKILTTNGVDVIRQKFFNVLKYSEDLEYYDRVTENGFDLEGACPTITTIHGSKGRQAEQVVAFTEMGQKCWDDRDSEHRLAYVAATRTQKVLEICQESMLGWSRVTHYPYPKIAKAMTPVDTLED